ncbi:TadE family protein [Nocardioides nanhaiensis]|uniref:TadE-like domain-containing protein n=1 Tax=Nocardioides nanhaiensis TaxID=1476871 RepID=A0ABP8WX24_9ACTN
MRGVQGRRRVERGAAAVEFALVAPLLLVIVFAIISYGVMFSFRQGLSQAAAEGARAAALAPATPTSTTFGAAAKARTAVAAALGSGYSCSTTGNLLMRGTTTVGTCTVTSPASCTTASCTYSVRLVYRYDDHPLVPTFPFVPVPEELVYVASAQGNG